MASSGILRRVALIRTLVTSQKTPFFIVIAVKTSDLTCGFIPSSPYVFMD
jgi:hypothetical protein